MRSPLFKWLAVVPAIAVFALLIGAIRAGSKPVNAVPATPTNAVDAWDVPTATYGEMPVDMIAAPVSERVPVLSEADYTKRVEARQQMPATKSGLPFLDQGYDAYVAAQARRNRLRITRLWYSRATSPEVAERLTFAFPAIATACADHTWTFAREHTVSFELATNLTGINVSTDGSPALTECFTTKLADKRALMPGKLTAKPGTKVVASFVVMKN